MSNSDETGNLAGIALLQAVGLISYCGIVALVFMSGNKWFGPMSWWGPLLFLVLFVVSALVSALITLGYMVYLIWDRKQVKEGLRVVTYTALWLLVFLGIRESWQVLVSLLLGSGNFCFSFIRSTE
jgi:hypothetical protein